MDAKLEMIFVNGSGNKVTLRVAEPKEDITAEEIKTAMETIIDKNVFTSTNGGDLVAIAGARIVTRGVTELDVL
jgi:hypothetical protein